MSDKIVTLSVAERYFLQQHWTPVRETFEKYSAAEGVFRRALRMVADDKGIGPAALRPVFDNDGVLQHLEAVDPPNPEDPNPEDAPDGAED